MASLFDISLLGYFSNIFVILFIFAASYAVLMFKKPLGDNPGINALLAATIAVIFIFSQDAIDVIKNTVPWFIVMMIALIFVLIITQSFNATMPVQIMSNIGSYVQIISVIILLISVSQKIGQSAGPYLSNETASSDTVVAGSSNDVGSGSFTQNFGATLFHPKVLALILVIVVAVFAVLWIGYRPF
jgi:hypothetical protein